MSETVIRCMLDLVIQIMDTTTGATIQPASVKFKTDGRTLNLQSRGSGTYILMNNGREDFTIEVDALGYEPYKARVSYEELDKALPLIGLYLIPKESLTRDFLSIEGNLPGINELSAVKLDGCRHFIRSFDPKKKQMTTLTLNGTLLTDVPYGLIHMGEEPKFEDFEVKELLQNGVVKISKNLEMEFQDKDPFARIVFGSTDENGNYLLRVADSGAVQRYLVRYRVGDDIRYKVIDFRDSDGVVLI